MKIGISAELIGTKAGGMETYDYNLVTALASIDNVNYYYIYTANEKALQELNDKYPNFSICFLGTTSRWRVVALSLPYELIVRPVDVFHATFVPPLFSPRKRIFTVHDIAFVIHPEWYPPRVRYRLSKFIGLGVKKAVKIIAVSETTKKDIINAYNVDKDRIDVVYEGVNSSFHPMKDRQMVRSGLQKYKIDGDYILYVGRFHVRKNLLRLLEAFRSMKRKVEPGLKLVLVGRDLYHAAHVFRAIRKMNLDKDVICPGHVDDGDLPLLYNGAKAFVYPSLFEGFGLPPLEAMACGTPVIASDRTALPEILGNAAVLVDPYDIHAMAEKMHQVMTNKALRNSLIKEGISRSKKFSWEDAATKTLRIYEDVYSQ